MASGNGNGGSTSDMDRKYRCYLVFLPNETTLASEAESWLKENFVDACQALGPNIFLLFHPKDELLRRARVRYGVTGGTHAVLIVLDVHPSKWKPGDPMAKIPFSRIGTREDILEVLYYLIDIAGQPEVVSKIRRGQLLSRLSQSISKYAPHLINAIKFVNVVATL